MRSRLGKASAGAKTIQGQMERWQYRPITVDGKAVSLCTTTTFIYTLQ